MAALPYLTSDDIASALSWPDAVDALARALATLDVADAPDRAIVEAIHGQLLLMPAEAGAFAGVKVLSLAPGNPARGLPRAQGLFVLFDAETLTPQALLDGGGLTSLRTPAVSALAVRQLAVADAERLVVFGTGPQAQAHIDAICAIRPVRSVVVVGRDATRATASAAAVHIDGVSAAAGSSSAVADADIVVCATSAREPVFDGALLAAHACVVALGAHEPSARELDDTTMARATRIVVEDRATALREAGDVVIAAAAGIVGPDDLVSLTELLALAPTDGITVFKSVGMGWEDLVIAGAVYAAQQM